MRLASRLGVFDDEAAAPPRPGGWILLFEPELHFGPKPDKLVPDLAGWRRERFPAIELEESDAAAISIPPDWVCEILSEGTEALDRGKKRRIYARERVAWLWYVDPRDRTLEVWSQKEGRWHEVDTFEGDSSVRAPPFDAIEIDLGALWRW